MPAFEPVGLRHPGVRHRRRVLDQRLHAAERHGQRRQVDVVHQVAAGLVPALQLEADHRAEPGHLPLHQLVLRVRFEADVAHPRHLRVRLEPPRDLHGVLLRPLDAQRQRLHAAAHQERLVRVHVHAQDHHHRAQPLVDLGRPWRR